MNKPLFNTLFVVCAMLIMHFTSEHCIAVDYTVPENTRIQTSETNLSTYGNVYITNENSQLYLDNQANLGTHANYNIKGDGYPEAEDANIKLGAIRFQNTGIVSGNIILQGNSSVRAYGGTGSFGNGSGGANINVGAYTFTVGGTTSNDSNFTWGKATITGTGTLNLNCNDVVDTGDMDFTNVNMSSFSGSTNITGVRMHVNSLENFGSTTGVTVNVKDTGQLFIPEGTVGSASTVATTRINLIGNGWNETVTRYGALRLDGALFATVGLDANAGIASINVTGTLNGTLDTKGHTLTINTFNKGLTINSSISGSGKITITGESVNIANIYGDNSSFTGNWDVSGGSLRSNNSTAVTAAVATDPRLGSGTITLRSGGLIAGAPECYISNNISINEFLSFLDSSEGNLHLMGNITGSGLLTQKGNFPVMLYGDNSAYSGIYQTGQDSHSHSGIFLMNNSSGSAQASWIIGPNNFLAGADGIGGAFEIGQLLVDLGSTLKAGSNALNVTTFKIGALSNDSEVLGTMDNNGTGVLAFEKVGTGKLTLSNSGNTFTGTATISEGTLDLTATNAIATSSRVINNAAITFNQEQKFKNLSSDTTDLIRSISGSAALTLDNYIETQYVGNIAASSIGFSGSGKIKINGKLKGSITSTGTPEIHLLGALEAGDLTISSGGTFSPGNSVGDFTVEAGNYTLESGAKHLVEFGGDPLGWDKLFVSGTVSLEAGSFIDISLAGVSLDDQLTYELISSMGDIDNHATLSGLTGWVLTVLVSGVDGYTNGLFLQKAPVPVPEPSTWALMILSALGLFFLRKRSA